MAKTKEQKKELVNEYKDKIKNAKALYFIEMKGIGANETSAIKKELYDLDSSFNVVKNRLFQIALEEENLKSSDDTKDGQQAVIFASEEGLTTAAKIISDFIKETEKAEIKSGILDDQIISREDVIELANLPGRDELIARVVGTMNAPITGFVTVLSGNMRNLVNVINAVKEQKESN